MQENSKIKEGGLLSLAKLMALPGLKIKIPIIQRDYAQGREIELEVRRTFIASIFEHLYNDKRINLDFVYGTLITSEEYHFVPLDGQQRLTTLFLLHWYLSSMEDKFDVFYSLFSYNGSSRFTYETRQSSKEFCDEFVQFNLHRANILNDSISDTIRDQAWFFLSWEDDPTVKSMLTMLDEIHGKFKDSGPFLDRVLDDTNPLITFQFLDLESFKLTDDLYIKMNARGKQLTHFETFKAKLEQHIGNLSFPDNKNYSLKFTGSNRQVGIPSYFSHKIDTDWANFFWEYKNIETNIFDDQLMNFIKFLAANYITVKAGSAPAQLRLLISNAKLSFRIYRDKIKCLEPAFILELIDTFDLLKDGDNKLQCFLLNSTYINEERLFKKAIENSLTYPERLRLYAVYQFVLINGSSDGIDEWARVIFNLTENTIFDEMDDFALAMGSLKVFLGKSSDILGYLAGSTERIRGFLEIQVREERIKACLLKKSNTWYDAIIKFESHGYFKGQISFLLNFSGIEDYFIANNNCDWDEEVDLEFFEKIHLYNEKAIAIFDDEGLRPFPNFIFERVLLTIGDYTLSAKSNFSFLVNSGRDTSWKRLLRDENDGRRGFVKSLMDHKEFSSVNIINSLQNIIGDGYEQENWAKDFIRFPEMLSYLGSQRYIRYKNEYNIQLLKKERLSGLHADYFSFAFYLKYIKGKLDDFGPFGFARYIEVAGDDSYPFLRLEDPIRGINMDIWFDPNLRKYQIDVLNKNREQLPKELQVFLEDEGWEIFPDNEYRQSLDSEAKTIMAVISVCNAVKDQQILVE